MNATNSMRQSNTLVALTLIVTLLFVACAGVPTVDDMTWQIVSVGSESIVFDTAMPQRPQLRFMSDSNRVMGFGGCNMLNGTYRQSADSIWFGTLATTRRGCPSMKVESQILAALDQVRIAKRKEDKLLLMAGDSVLLVLQGTPWIEPTAGKW